MNSAELGHLLEEAVECHRNDNDDAYKQFLAVVDRLRPYGIDVVVASQEMFRRGSVLERSTAADVFARMAFEASKEVEDACFVGLADALKHELAGPAEPEVVQSIASAFGHTYDDRAVPLLIDLASHSSNGVRFAVAAALPSACSWTPIPAAVKTLVGLTTDVDDDVRDWACFGLGQLHATTENVREALAARLDDEHINTRSEALVALAAFCDERVVDRLLLRLDGNDVWMLEVVAAAKVADPRLHPLLLKIREWWTDDGDIEKLNYAIRRCDPNAAASAERYEQEVLGILSAKAEAIGVAIELDGSYPLTVIRGRRNGEVTFEERFWSNDDPLSTLDADVEASSWLLTLEPFAPSHDDEPESQD